MMIRNSQKTLRQFPMLFCLSHHLYDQNFGGGRDGGWGGGSSERGGGGVIKGLSKNILKQGVGKGKSCS